MYLEETKSTPEVACGFSKSLTITISGPCYPQSAEEFFSRVIEGAPENIRDVPGLRAVLEGYQGQVSVKLLFNLRTINSRSEKGPLLDLLDLLHEHKVEIEWVRHENDDSNVRVCGILLEHWARKCGFVVK